MGLRGPQALDDAEKIRRGNPGKRKIVKPEEQGAPPSSNMPAAAQPVKKPTWLSTPGSKYWDEKAPEWQSVGLLHPVDADLFGAYANLMGHYVHCQRYLKKNGQTFKGTNGHRQTRPEVSQAQKSLTEAIKIGEKLGISLKARKAMDIRLTTPAPPKNENDQRKANVLKPRSE